MLLCFNNCYVTKKIRTQILRQHNSMELLSPSIIICKLLLQSARRRDLYLTTHDTQNRQISMPRWDSNPRFQQVSGLRPVIYIWSAYS